MTHESVNTIQSTHVSEAGKYVYKNMYLYNGIVKVGLLGAYLMRSVFQNFFYFLEKFGILYFFMIFTKYHSTIPTNLGLKFKPILGSTIA